MKTDKLAFKPDQWEFLATFKALKGFVHIDVVAAVSPVSPSSLIEVVKRAGGHDILTTNSDGLYCISSGVPDHVAKRLQGMNTVKRLKTILEKIESLNLQNHLSREAYSNLLVKTGNKEIGEVEAELARQALIDRQVEKANEHFIKALKALAKQSTKRELKTLFVTCALAFSDLSFGLGKNFKEVNDYLEQAKDISTRFGDKRSLTMVNLHLGRILYLQERQHEAIEMMSAGQVGVDELDDEDIRTRSAEFFALYFFVQGKFSKAMNYFEQAYRYFEVQKADQITNLSVPIFYGYCAAFLGQYQKAIGCLDSAWRRAREESNPAFTPAIRATLGTILILINNKNEGLIHLKAAWKESNAYSNMLGKHLAASGMALNLYLEGNISKAHKYLSIEIPDSSGFSINSFFSMPWMLEIVFEFYRLGLPEIPKTDYDIPAEKLVNVPSVHIRGVIWRLFGSHVIDDDLERKSALKVLKKDKLFLDLPNRSRLSSKKEIRLACFRLSEAYLMQSGDPIQLAKTQIEMARLMLDEKNMEEARRLAQKARKGLSGTWEDYFPDGIRFLLEDEKKLSEKTYDSMASITQFLDVTNEFSVSLSMNTVIDSLVPAMNRYFRAERGAVFWVVDKRKKRLEMRASRNLFQYETKTHHFRPHMQLIYDCFRKKQSMLLRSSEPGKKLAQYGVYTLLCIPLVQEGNVCGVLYHDNSYLSDSIKYLKIDMLDKMSLYLNTYIDRMTRMERQIDAIKEGIWEKVSSEAQPEDHTMLFECEKMRNILQMADKVAFTDTTVLIQGETGVGKDLLARRIHRMSQRSKKPFVIIDSTTIPENLVESELFGHEKGAFTGADRQKIGRIELANQGTLFIDEISEIPLTIQAKLLRILQEKTFSRIGGNQTLTSDFRLIAASNRHLPEEVNCGRFRQDLFYRLNTVPITLPPLRDRNGDIILLGSRFLDQFAKKHLQDTIRFRPDQESALLNYDWPGNIRELKSVIERTVILSTDGHLDLKLDLHTLVDEQYSFVDTPSFEELQRRYFRYVLKKSHGRVGGEGGAAELTGLNRSTLNSRLKRLDLK